MKPVLDALEAELAAMTARGEASVAKVDLIHALTEALVPRTPERLLALNEEALALSETLGYRGGEAFSLGLMGFAQYMLARYHEALASLGRSIARAQEAGHARAEAYALSSLVYVHQTLGDHDEALDAGLRALPLFRALPERSSWEGWTYLALDDTYAALHQDDQAMAATQQALAVFDAVGHRLGRARAFVHLAAGHERQGRLEDARPYLEQSLALFRDLDDPVGASRTLNDLGTLHRRLGKLDDALAFHTEGLRIRESIGNTQAQCTSLVDLGRLHLERNDVDAALAALHRALGIAESLGLTPKAYRAHESLADAYERRGDLADALAHHRAFHRLKEEVVGEETRSSIHQLQVRFAVAQAESAAEIERLRSVELQGLLDELRATQAQLIHAEKMASLGQLTAGIAHEIKNPLNFVTNFALLSTELAAEIAAELDAAADRPVAEVRADLGELLDDLRANTEKITEHGRRADGIVRAMMAHARGAQGVRQRVALHPVLDESIRLAVGAHCAARPEAEVSVETRFDEAVGDVEVVPPEIGRVLMNLLGNAFDAVAEREASADDGYVPAITVATRRLEHAVEIRVTDNGAGIPEAVRDTLFEPFVTTKPAGSGTGLGLSLSHDIVTQGHRGTLTVESTAGGGATFVLTLPVGGDASQA